MSLRWSSYVAPKPPKGSNTQNGLFSSKIALRLKNVSLCENRQRQCCKAFIGLTVSAMVGGGATHSTWNFESNWPRWSEIGDFPSIFACSASAVTPSENSSINTIGIPLRVFQISPRWTSYVVPNPPTSPPPKKRGTQKRKVSKIWTAICDNFETVRDRMWVIINR